MSHIIDTDKVNQFLPNEKLSIDTTGDAQALHTYANGRELETTIWDIVVTTLNDFDISNWTNSSDVPIPNNVPSLIKNIMGMWVAGHIYKKQFSEESAEANNYGDTLIAQAYELLNGIVSGALVIGSVDVLIDSERATFEAPTVFETEPIFTTGVQF